MPKACPYVMMRPPIVAVINHRICEGNRNSDLFLFAFSDNLISEDWFFAEGELLFMFLFQSPSIFPLNRYCHTTQNREGALVASSLDFY
mgnify:CR=1 FL=1